MLNKVNAKNGNIANQKYDVRMNMKRFVHAIRDTPPNKETVSWRENPTPPAFSKHDGKGVLKQKAKEASNERIVERLMTIMHQDRKGRTVEYMPGFRIGKGGTVIDCYAPTYTSENFEDMHNRKKVREKKLRKIRDENEALRMHINNAKSSYAVDDLAEQYRRHRELTKLMLNKISPTTLHLGILKPACNDKKLTKRPVSATELGHNSSNHGLSSHVSYNGHFDATEEDIQIYSGGMYEAEKFQRTVTAQYEDMTGDGCGPRHVSRIGESGAEIAATTPGIAPATNVSSKQSNHASISATPAGIATLRSLALSRSSEAVLEQPNWNNSPVIDREAMKLGPSSTLHALSLDTPHALRGDRLMVSIGAGHGSNVSPVAYAVRPDEPDIKRAVLRMSLQANPGAQYLHGTSSAPAGSNAPVGASRRPLSASAAQQRLGREVRSSGYGVRPTVTKGLVQPGLLNDKRGGHGSGQQVQFAPAAASQASKAQLELNEWVERTLTVDGAGHAIRDYAAHDPYAYAGIGAQWASDAEDEYAYTLEWSQARPGARPSNGVGVGVGGVGGGPRSPQPAGSMVPPAHLSRTVQAQAQTPTRIYGSSSPSPARNAQRDSSAVSSLDHRQSSSGAATASAAEGSGPGSRPGPGSGAAPAGFIVGSFATAAASTPRLPPRPQLNQLQDEGRAYRGRGERPNVWPDAAVAPQQQRINLQRPQSAGPAFERSRGPPHPRDPHGGLAPADQQPLQAAAPALRKGPKQGSSHSAGKASVSFHDDVAQMAAAAESAVAATHIGERGGGTFAALVFEDASQGLATGGDLHSEGSGSGSGWGLMQPVAGAGAGAGDSLTSSEAKVLAAVAAMSGGNGASASSRGDAAAGCLRAGGDLDEDVVLLAEERAASLMAEMQHLQGSSSLGGGSQHAAGGGGAAAAAIGSVAGALAALAAGGGATGGLMGAAVDAEAEAVGAAAGSGSVSRLNLTLGEMFPPRKMVLMEARIEAHTHLHSETDTQLADGHGLGRTFEKATGTGGSSSSSSHVGDDEWQRRRQAAQRVESRLRSSRLPYNIRLVDVGVLCSSSFLRHQAGWGSSVGPHTPDGDELDPRGPATGGGPGSSSKRAQGVVESQETMVATTTGIYIEAYPEDPFLFRQHKILAAGRAAGKGAAAAGGVGAAVSAAVSAGAADLEDEDEGWCQMFVSMKKLRALSAAHAGRSPSSQALAHSLKQLRTLDKSTGLYDCLSDRLDAQTEEALCALLLRAVEVRLHKGVAHGGSEPVLHAELKLLLS